MAAFIFIAIFFGVVTALAVMFVFLVGVFTIIDAYGKPPR